MTPGFFLDSAQTIYQLAVWWQRGDVTPTLRLFQSADRIGPGTDVNELTQLRNDSYSPLPVPNGYLRRLNEPAPPHYAVMDAEFTLAPPELGNDTIYGWWIDGYSALVGAREGMWGGNFDPPVVIPPSGMSLTIDQIDLYLGACSATYLPTPLARWDTFAGPNGQLMPDHAPEVGGPYVIEEGSPQLLNGTMIGVTNGGADSAVFDVGSADWFLSVVHHVTADTFPLIVFRYESHDDLWYAYCNLSTWTITERVANVDTPRNIFGAGLTPGTTVTLTLYVHGAHVFVFVDGAFQVSYDTMATGLDRTWGGIVIVSHGGVPTGSFDDLRVLALP